MAAFSPFLRFLKWKMDGKMEDGKWIHHPWAFLEARGEVRQVALMRSRLTQRFPQADWTAWSLPGSTSGQNAQFRRNLSEWVSDYA